MPEVIAEGRLRRVLRNWADDRGWLRQHPRAQMVAREPSDQGWRIELQDGDEHRTYVTDAVGNPVLVLP